MKGAPPFLKVIEIIFQVIIVVLITWMVVGEAVFRFRHPWATETEIFMNMDKALGFRKVSQNELRD